MSTLKRANIHSVMLFPRGMQVSFLFVILFRGYVNNHCKKSRYLLSFCLEVVNLIISPLLLDIAFNVHHESVFYARSVFFKTNFN